jgi:hypothetical protein
MITENKNQINMKKILLVTAVFLIYGFTLLAQAPPPPPADAGAGNPGPVGGGAPIGSGIIILLALGAGYGTKKVFEAGKKKQI